MSRCSPSPSLSRVDWAFSIVFNSALALAFVGLQWVRPEVETPLPAGEMPPVQENPGADNGANKAISAGPTDAQTETAGVQSLGELSPASPSGPSAEPPGFAEAVAESSWSRLMGELIPSAADAAFRDEFAQIWTEAADGRETTPEAQIEALSEAAGALRKDITAQFQTEAVEATTRALAAESWKRYVPAVREGAAKEIPGALDESGLGDPGRVGQFARVMENRLPQETQEAARSTWKSNAAPDLAEASAHLLAKALADRGVDVGSEAFLDATRDAASRFAETAKVNLGDSLRPVTEAAKAPGSKKRLDGPDQERAEALAKEVAEKIGGGAAAAAKASARDVSGNFRPPVSPLLAAKLSTLRRIEARMSALASGRGRAGSLAGSLAALAGGGADPGQPTFQNADAQMAEAGGEIAYDHERHARLLARLEGREAGGIASLSRVAGDGGKAGRPAGARAAARIFALPEGPSGLPPAETDNGLVTPDFPHSAFTIATYTDAEPVIDGDLSDWNPEQPGATTATRSDGNPPSQPTTVRFRWSPRGLYFSYALDDAGGLHVSSGAPYHGDCFELYLDTANSRVANRSDSDTAHQYFFTPFGYRGEDSDTFQRAGGKVPGPRGLSDGELNRRRDISFAKARQTATGYQVEGFLARSAVTQPFLPGSILGLEFSISRDWNFPAQMQWHTPKSVDVWKHPNLWGDLLLLGTDAKISFPIEPGGAGERQAAAPGDSVLIRIEDPDMNLDPASVDTVAVRVDFPTGDSRVLFLEETSPTSGAFEGFAPLPASTQAGNNLQITHVDAVSSRGERNLVLQKSLRLGWPLLQIANIESRP